MKKVLVFLFFFTFYFNPAQNNRVDSLNRALKIATQDSVKLNLRRKIGIFTPINRIGYWDTLVKDARKLNLKYYEGLALRGIGNSYEELQTGGKEKSIECLNKALKIFEELNDKKEIGECYYAMGLIFNDHGDAPKAIQYFQKGLKIFEEAGLKNSVGESLNNIGFIYQSLGDIDQCLDYYLKAIKIFESIGAQKNEAYLLNNIAFLYLSQGDTAKALENYFKCLKIGNELSDGQALSNAYNNLTIIYLKRDEVNKALGCALKSLGLRREMKDKKGIASSFSSLATIYEAIDDKNSGSYDRSLNCLLQSFEIRKTTGDKNLIARSYCNLASIYFKQQKYDLATECAENGLTLAKELGYPALISMSSKTLYKVYKQKNNTIKALEMYELFINMRDSTKNDETRKSSVKKQFQYEYDKKVTADSIRAIEEKKTVAIQLKQEQTQRYALYGGLFLVLIFAVFMFNRFKITQKQKVVIEQQKHIVDEKQKEILDSITYAKRLQEAILPAEVFWSSNFKNGFVFYEPKDIVAGDFYWLEKVNDLVLFAVADCTGHGVPGALVSVVCSNALNRTVLEFGITDPGKILDKTRELVIATFEKSGEEVKDGMDISLCCLNKNTNELLWAGANNPLWYTSSTVKDDLALKEIKANKQPIGKYAINQPFVTHKIQLNAGDTVYLFTDGIADQFGGPKGKKFKYTRLKELLIINIALTMDEQKANIESAFKSWKGDLEQVDDVCVIGMRL